MELAFYMLLALVGVGALLRFFHKPEGETGGDDSVEDSEDAECCGMHITCEKDSLLAAVSSRVEYYDDEELDAYRGIAADAYDNSQVEQFRDVLLTLLPDDIAGWARSLQLRGIELPSAVREELLMIVAETRRSRGADKK